MLQRMFACRLTRRRLQRFLDNDPARQLSLAAKRVVARHLDDCPSCAELARHYRLLNSALRRLGTFTEPNPASLARLNALLVQNEGKS